MNMSGWDMRQQHVRLLFILYKRKGFGQFSVIQAIKSCGASAERRQTNLSYPDDTGRYFIIWLLFGFVLWQGFEDGNASSSWHDDACLAIGIHRKLTALTEWFLANINHWHALWSRMIIITDYVQLYVSNSLTKTLGTRVAVKENEAVTILFSYISNVLILLHQSSGSQRTGYAQKNCTWCNRAPKRYLEHWRLLTIFRDAAACSPRPVTKLQTDQFRSWLSFTALVNSERLRDLDKQLEFAVRSHFIPTTNNKHDHQILIVRTN